MFESAAESPVSQTISARSGLPPARNRRVNPAIVPPIVNLLESGIIALSGLAALSIIGNLSRFGGLIIMMIGVASVCFSLIIGHGPKSSPEKFLQNSLGTYLIFRNLLMIMPLSVAYFLFSFISMNQNQILPHAVLSEVLRLWTLIAVITMAIMHACTWYLVRRWRFQGVFAQAVAIVGAGKNAHRLIRWLEFAHSTSVEVVGVFDDRTQDRAAQLPLGHLVRGTIDDLLLISQQIHIDRVLVALPHAAEQRLLYILKKLRRLPADITLAPDLIAFAVAEQSDPRICSLPLFDVYARPLKIGEQLAKTIFDRIVAAGLIALFLPVILVICLAIALDSPGPILFRQPRYGVGHRTITVLKFRTMYAELSDHSCFRQTQINDIRTTRVGRWLRSLSLDELPQLLNVLRGDMSLVGPRPLAIEMRVEDKLNEDLVSEYCFRHRIKPGITGWAQIHGLRGAIHSRDALQQRVSYDLYYIDNWSFWLDIKILILTAITIFNTKNTY